MADNSPPKHGAAGGAAAGADSASRRWEWWSTHESIAAEVPSVWAIVETALAVAAYWGAAIWFETYAFLLAGVAIAPMVLLRSDASVALGLRLFQGFETYLNRTPKKQSWRKISGSERALFIISLTVATVTSFGIWSWLSARFLVGLEGSQAFFCGAVIMLLVQAGSMAVSLGAVGSSWGAPLGFLGGLGGGLIGIVAAGTGAAAIGGATLALAATVATVVAQPLTLKGPAAGVREVLSAIFATVGGLAMATTLVVVSFIIRTLATLRHLSAGLLSMPHNFRRLALSTSPVQTPELVPGIGTIQSEFRLDRLLAVEKNWFGTYITKIALLAYVPAWLYRFSIKSTSWFWWPLAYIGSEPHEARDPEHMRKLVLGSPFRRLGRWIAIASLLAFAVVSAWDYFRTHGFDLPALPTQTLVIGFVLTRLADVPWQVAGLISAATALFVFMWTSHAAISLDHANDKRNPAILDAAKRQFVWIARFGRFGFVCTVLYWLGLAGHLALYVNSQRCWIDAPPAVAAWAKKFYGDLAPPLPPCNEPRRTAAHDSQRRHVASSRSTDHRNAIGPHTDYGGGPFYGAMSDFSVADLGLGRVPAEPLARVR